MDLSDDDSSRGSGSSRSKKTSKGKSNGRSQSSSSKSKSSSTVTSEQIEQFCAVTGSTDEVARNMIEACNGNLEMAVNMHMEGMAGTSGVEPVEDYVRAPIPQKQEVLVPSGYEGYGFGQKGKRRIIKSVFDSFRNFEVEAKLQESRLMNNQGASTSESSTSGRRTLEDLFRPPLDLMFTGNIQEARDAAQMSRKWLIVNIQNVSEFPCQVLNRDVWSNRTIKELVKENFLFLQVYMDSEEGQRYMTFYKVNQWPYVAVLDPRTGELMVEWSITDPSTYIELITDFLGSNYYEDDYQGAPEAKKRKMETILDASEDDQLQAAIRASLAAENRPSSSNDDDEDNEVESQSESGDWFDSESESRIIGPQAASASEETADGASSQPTEAAETPQAPEEDKDDWKKHLGPETDPLSSIIFRYPDGTKEQWSLPCTSTIQAVLKYVNGKGFPPDKYELMANFPKRLLLSMEATMTLKEAGLFPQDTIFVQAR